MDEFDTLCTKAEDTAAAYRADIGNQALFDQMIAAQQALMQALE